MLVFDFLCGGVKLMQESLQKWANQSENRKVPASVSGCHHRSHTANLSDPRLVTQAWGQARSLPRFRMTATPRDGAGVHPHALRDLHALAMFGRRNRPCYGGAAPVMTRLGKPPARGPDGRWTTRSLAGQADLR